MDFVLIISILIMCYISNRYYNIDYFESFLGNILVQLFHIVTLGFVIFVSIIHGSFLVWLVCIYGVRKLLDNICDFVMDIIDAFKNTTDDNIDSNKTDQTETDDNKEDR